MVEIYTDASIVAERVGIAIVIVNDSEVMYTFSRDITNHVRKPSSKHGEAYAVVLALGIAKELCLTEVIVNYDSSDIEFLRKSEPPIDGDLVELYKSYRLVMSYFETIKFKKIKGHKGCPFNSMVDSLARCCL